MSKQLTKTNGSAVQTSEVPKYLQQDETGAEDIGSAVQIPYVKIAQALSKDAIKAGIKAGNFYETLENKDLGTSIKFHIILFYRSRVWFSKADRKFMMGEHYSAAEEKLVQYGPAVDRVMADKTLYEEGKEANNYWIVPLKALESGKIGDMPFYIFSCMSAALKPARALNTKLKLNAQSKLPIWAQTIEAKTTEVSFPQGDAFMPSFSYGGYATEQQAEVLRALYEQAKTYHNAGVAGPQDPAAE